LYLLTYDSSKKQHLSAILHFTVLLWSLVSFQRVVACSFSY